METFKVGDRVREFIPWLGYRSGRVYYINDDGAVFYRDDSNNEPRMAGPNAEKI